MSDILGLLISNIIFTYLNKKTYENIPLVKTSKHLMIYSKFNYLLMILYSIILYLYEIKYIKINKLFILNQNPSYLLKLLLFVNFVDLCIITYLSISISQNSCYYLTQSIIDDESECIKSNNDTKFDNKNKLNNTKLNIEPNDDNSDNSDGESNKNISEND